VHNDETGRGATHVNQMIDVALSSENSRLRGIDRERLQREGHVRLTLEQQLPDSGSQFSDFLPV